MTSSTVTPLFTGPDWTFSMLQTIIDECEKIAVEELELDLYPNQIEIISSSQMLDAYASIGMPVMYSHWSWGKSFAQNEQSYRKGYQGLAYEIVINSQPCISYLMEENSATMQTLVIAHAAMGHNSFFKSNEFFRQWTDAAGIIDYLVFAKNYINECEEKYGYQEVEKIIDSTHALKNYGVDRYKRPAKLSCEQEQTKLADLLDHQQQEINELWKTLPNKVVASKNVSETEQLESRQKLLNLPEENLLYFIEKKSPSLKPWQREIVRIVRKISQYFMPQRQTQVQNEGWASFVHYYIMNRLHEKGLITDGSMLEFIDSHSGVLNQLPYDHKYYSGFNPYALGFAIYNDIKRICQHPTDEDREWFPDLVDKPWLPELHNAMRNFRDESFIRQYLSPTVMRDWRLFAMYSDSDKDHYDITAIHNQRGYKQIRNALADQYNFGSREPDLQVWDVELMGNRHLVLRHTIHNDIPLCKDTPDVLRHLSRLWGYNVSLESYNSTTDEVVVVHKLFK